ncbi:pyridoxamine 5'-phosphate oxidase family protein [Paenibacillus typhae]|uniref:pyridoxamine 5'-phosphate oxidase family protein n=1 Tax=Paenibacillus typhae TaxID=1174501 RepID=UPI001C8E8ED3|nr:pyridoxamine 5'-phosphate oxidase family protein [Paenibacillus typhae]MBY0009987.1 pyridoxamine 5'-phosphate oxidase family protein [Paenibacillus typhae]
MNKYDEAMKLLDTQAGNKDGLITLSTIALEPGLNGHSRPASRIVDAYYEDGAFYTVTNAASNKMQQIAQNPEVSVCIIVENFTADGIGENLGWVCDEKNTKMMTKLRAIFADWYNEANNDEDPNTCLLRIRLTKGLWNDAHKGIRNEIDFVNKTAFERIGS